MLYAHPSPQQESAGRPTRTVKTIEFRQLPYAMLCEYAMNVTDIPSRQTRVFLLHALTRVQRCRNLQAVKRTHIGSLIKKITPELTPELIHFIKWLTVFVALLYTNTRLPSNLKPTIREYVHLVPRGHFSHVTKMAIIPFNQPDPKTQCYTKFNDSVTFYVIAFEIYRLIDRHTDKQTGRLDRNYIPRRIAGGHHLSRHTFFQNSFLKKLWGELNWEKVGRCVPPYHRPKFCIHRPGMESVLRGGSVRGTSARAGSVCWYNGDRSLPVSLEMWEWTDGKLLVTFCLQTDHIIVIASNICC